MAMPVIRLTMPAAAGSSVNSRRAATPRKTLRTGAIAAQVSPSVASCTHSGREAAAETNRGRKATKNTSDLAFSGPIPAATTT